MRQENLFQPFEILSSPFLLSVVIVVVFLFFQISFIWTGISNAGGAGMHAFWQPSPDRLDTPYFAATAALLLLWALYGGFLAASLLQGKLSIGRALYSLIVLTVLGLWSAGMVHFWRAMAFERGELAAEDWFDADNLKLYQSRHLYYRAKPDYAFLAGSSVAVRVPDEWHDVSNLITSTAGPGLYFNLPEGPDGGAPAYPALSVQLLNPLASAPTPDKYLEHILSGNVQLLQLAVPLEVESAPALRFAYVPGSDELPDNARVARIETVVLHEDMTYICRAELVLSRYAQWRWIHDQFCSTLELNSKRPRPLQDGGTF